MTTTAVSKWSGIVLIAGVLGFAPLGCGTTMLKLEGVSGDVPPSEGMARVKSKGYGSAQVDVRVSNLAPIHNVDAKATHYVVWAQGHTRGDVPQNLGAMGVANDGTAIFRGYVEDTDLDLFITAE